MTPIPSVTAVPPDLAPAAASPPPGPAPSRGADFGAVLAAKTPPADGTAAIRAPRVRTPETTGEAFEAAMLVPFVAAMLPPEESEIWGGTGGAMWRGLFADALAADVASAGGVGLAAMVDTMLAARNEPLIPSSEGDPA